MKSKSMIQELTDLTRLSFDSDRELSELKLIRIPVGTFAGTVERVFVIRDSQAHAFDTGDQGGGQC